MFKKVSKIIVGGMFFLGSEIMAEPLRNYNDVVGLIVQISVEGFVNSDLAARIEETVNDEDTPLPIRVFILNELKEQEELNINNGIQYLLEQSVELKGLPGEYANMNRDMKLAHMLWLSQTENCAGDELKEGWGASCLVSIGEILQEQQQPENKEAAEVLHRKIRKILKKNNIETNQFGL